MNRTVVGIICIIFLMACGAKNSPKLYIDHKGYAAGTNYIIEYENNAGNLKEELNNLLDDFNSSIAITNTQSAISKLNNNDSGAVNNIHVVNLFKISNKIYTETNGAFDPTMSKVYTWYGKEVKKFIYPELLDTNDIDSVSTYTGFKQLGLVNGSVVKKRPGIYTDFNELYHGYMADEIALLFNKFNVVNYRIEVGGVMVAKGVDSNKKNWMIAIDKPTDENKERHLLGTTTINGSGFAVAGSYRNFYTKELMKLPYTINPATLYPVKHTLISVAVFAPTGVEAEAYAHAFMVMGPEETKTFLLQKPSLEVYMITANYKGEWQTYLSESLASRLVGVKY